MELFEEQSDAVILKVPVQRSEPNKAIVGPPKFGDGVNG